MSRLKVLASLARLARDELDRRRQELAAIDEQLTELRTRALAFRAELPSVVAAGWELPGGPAPLGRWLAAARERELALRCEIEALVRRREEALAALEAQLAAKRRQERLLERTRAELVARAAEAERKQVDELATLRHAHAAGGAPQNSGASVTVSPSSSGVTLI
jgi:septal ring factor EnvC (AmiA/AmiB activator)